jgi:hypothetical protein
MAIPFQCENKSAFFSKRPRISSQLFQFLKQDVGTKCNPRQCRGLNVSLAAPVYNLLGQASSEANQNNNLINPQDEHVRLRSVQAWGLTTPQ